MLVTIERFIDDQQDQFPHDTGTLTRLLQDVALAAKVIYREVAKAGLVNILGLTNKVNVHGERLQRLDEYANDEIRKTLEPTGRLCLLASEEEEGLIHVPEKCLGGGYVLLYDPLDVSSNIDANVSIGTIFSIHRKISNTPKGEMQDCLQKGRNQVAAGYIVYGSSMMFVFTSGNGVHGFTLDPSVGEFLLSHPNIQIPPRGRILSVNEGNYEYWDDGVRQYVDYLKQPDKESGRPYTSRYIGSLVADFHRNLLYGGIFLYPADKKDPKRPSGKLRLLYEASPLAFVVEQAGGRASDGHQPILDIQPTELHQHTPLFIGSSKDVLEAEAFVRGERE